MNDQVKYTPGPWLAAARPSSVVGWPIVQPGTGRSICSVTYVQHSKIDPPVPGDSAFNRESAANARLIAAAPELLEALQIASITLFSFDGGNQHDETGWEHDEMRDAWLIVQSAIKKATGGDT